MSLALEMKPPELVVRTSIPRRLEERSGMCDLVWACVLDDYLDIDNTEQSDDNSDSTADVRRAERRKVKKMKKREKKLRARLILAHNLQTISDEDENDDDGDLKNSDHTLPTDAEASLENRDTSESVYVDADPGTDIHDRLGDKYLPRSDVQRKQIATYNDNAELHDQTISKKTLYRSHRLPGSRERSVSTHEARGRLISMAGELGGSFSTPGRIGKLQTVHDREPPLLPNELADESRFSHEKQEKVFLEQGLTVIHPPAIVPSGVASMYTRTNPEIRHLGAFTDDAVVKRVPVDPLEELPSRSPRRPTFRPPRPPKPDDPLHGGSKDNPINILNGMPTAERNPTDNLQKGKQWLRRTETSAKRTTQIDMPKRMTTSFYNEGSYRHSRIDLLTSQDSVKKRDSVTYRPTIDNMYPLEESTVPEETESALDERVKVELDDLRRKRLDRKDALLRIRAIKARIAQMDP